MAVRLCPACAEFLELVERFRQDGTPYMVWECPNQDYFDPLSRSAPEASAQEAPPEDAATE